MRCFLLTFFCLSHALFSQSTGHLFRIVENGRFGFIDGKGKVVINPQFRFAGDFYGGLAKARSDSGYGFINPRGEFVIPPVYDYADDFYDTTAMVVFQSKKYFVNKRGKLLPFTDSSYAALKNYYKETFAVCDTPLIIMSGWEYHTYQISDYRRNNVRATYFDEMERRFPLYENSSSPSVFRQELMLVVKNGNLCYVDTSGHVVWQAFHLEKPKGQALNLDFRIHQNGNCVVFPAVREKYQKGLFDLDSMDFFSLRAFPNEKVINQDGILCMNVRLIHHSRYNDTIIIRNPYLFFILEIKTSQGKWVPFESRCGTPCLSLFSEKKPDTLVTIPSGYFWTFQLPTYEGTHKAQFRYCMHWLLDKVYSNEFEGNYNLAQLINRGIEYSGNLILDNFGQQKASHEYFLKEVEDYNWCGVNFPRQQCYDDNVK